MREAVYMQVPVVPQRQIKHLDSTYLYPKAPFSPLYLMSQLAQSLNIAG